MSNNYWIGKSMKLDYVTAKSTHVIKFYDMLLATKHDHMTWGEYFTNRKFFLVLLWISHNLNSKFQMRCRPCYVYGKTLRSNILGILKIT